MLTAASTEKLRTVMLQEQCCYDRTRPLLAADGAHGSYSQYHIKPPNDLHFRKSNVKKELSLRERMHG